MGVSSDYAQRHTYRAAAAGSVAVAPRCAVSTVSADVIESLALLMLCHSKKLRRPGPGAVVDKPRKDKLPPRAAPALANACFKL